MPGTQKITTERTEKEEFDASTGDIIGAAIEVHSAPWARAFRIGLRSVFEV